MKKSYSGILLAMHSDDLSVNLVEAHTAYTKTQVHETDIC